MSVTVVGCTGYIGFGVTLAFRRAGYRVYGVFRDEKKKRLLLKNEIIPIIGDISTPQNFKEQLEKSDIIVDAVGYGPHAENFFDFVTKLKNNSIYNYRSLYIFTSGIMTYGPGFKNRFVDENVLPNPGQFVKARRNFEDKVLSHNKDIRTVVVRPGFVYGGTGGPVFDLFFNIKPDQDLILVGSKDKKWSWVHVDDLGDAYVRIAKAGSIIDNQLFNIAALDNPTYEELRLACAHVSGWHGNVKHVEVPADDVLLQVWEADVTVNPRKAAELLGWHSTHVGVLQEIELFYHSWLANKT